MTLLEYVQTLRSDISVGEKIALTKSWKNKNETPTEQEAIEETVVEEAKIDPAAEPDATATGTTEPVSKEEFMKSISGNGIFDSLKNTTLDERLNSFGQDKSDNPLLEPVKSNFDIKDLDKTFFQQVGLEQVFTIPDSFKKVAAVGETYNPRGNYDYKYEINKETKSLDYYAKATDEDEYKLQTDNYAVAKVAEVFDHLNKDQLKSLGLYDKQVSSQKKEKNVIKNLPSFEEFENLDSDSLEFSYIKSTREGMTKSDGGMPIADIFAKISEIDEIIADFTVTEVVEDKDDAAQIFQGQPIKYKEEKKLNVKTKEGEAYLKKLIKLRKKLADDVSWEMGMNPDFNTEDIKDAKRIANEMSYLGNLFNNIREGGTTLGQHMAEVPETLYEIFAAPQKLLEYSGLVEGYVAPTAVSASKNFGYKNYILDYYIEEQEKLGLINKEYDEQNYEEQGVFASFRAGNYLEGAKQIGAGLANSAPVSMSMMIGGAYMKTGQFLTAGTIGFAGKEIREMRDAHPAMKEMEVLTTSLGIAGSETFWGLIGKGTVGKSYRTIIAKEGKEEGVKIFRKTLIDTYEAALRKYGAAAGILGEGIEEVATQITQNLLKGLDPFLGVPDAFILGMSGGGLYSSPVNVVQAKRFVQNGIANRKVDNVLLKYGINNLNEAFNTQTLTTESEIDILNVKNSLQVISSRIDKQVTAGTITKAQGDSIKQRARDVQNSSTALGRIDVSQEDQSGFIDLMIEQKQLKNKIKEVDNPSLTKQESTRLDQINITLNDLVVASRTQKIEGEIETIKQFAPEGSVFTYDTTTEFVEATGADADADAFISEDGKIYINKQRAAEVGAITAASHERLHQILRSTFANPENALKLVEQFKKILKPKELAIVQKRIDENYADASPLKQAEEYLTAFSDAIGKGELTWADNLTETFMKLAKPILDIFRAKGYGKLEFRTGRDVYEFIKDYQKNIQQGTQSARAEALSTQSEGITTTETQESKTEISKQNLETAKENLKVEEEIINIGAFKVSELDGENRTKIVKKLTNLNLGAVKNLAAKAANNPNIQSLEKGKRKTFKDFEQGYAEELTKIINNYEPIIMSGKDAGKRIPFGAYLQQRLKLRYGNVLTELKKGEIEATSIDTKEAKEVEDISSSSTTQVTEVDTDVKLVDNIKIDKQPLSVEFKDKVRGFVTEQLEGLDPQSEQFRKQAFKPSKAFVDLVAKDIIGSPKKFREFLNENPTFYKGLNITELIAIDDGRVKKGQPRLFTEVNKRLTKQSEIEKFMMQGRVPYLTTAQQKAGANLYNRLTPKVAAVVNNFFGSTPSNNSNRKRAIAKAIANKFIAEAAPSTEAFKAKPQDVRAKTAEKLQVSQNAKFSKTLLQQNNIEPGVVNDFLKATSSKDFTNVLKEKLKDKNIKSPWLDTANEYFKENPIAGIPISVRKKISKEISLMYSMAFKGEVALKREVTNKGVDKAIDVINENLYKNLTFGYSYDTIDLIFGDKTNAPSQGTLEGINDARLGLKLLVDNLYSKGYTANEIKSFLDGAFVTPAGLGQYRGGTKANSIVLDEANLGLFKGGSRGSIARDVADFNENFIKDLDRGDKVSISGDTYTKNYWTNPKSVYNRLSPVEQFDFLENLYNKGKENKKDLVDVIKSIQSLEVDDATKRWLTRGLFADMSALGKRSSTVRYVLTNSNGNILSFKQLEDLGLNRAKGDQGVFEHTKPANRVGVAAYAYVKTGDARLLKELQNELANFDSALISESMDDSLRDLKLQSKMGEDYKSTDSPMVTRYKEMISDLAEKGVFFYDFKTKKQITPLEALSDGLVELETDDVQSIKEYKKEVAINAKFSKSKKQAAALDSGLIPDAIKYDRPISVQTAINALAKTDKALANGRKLDQPVKKIRVFDFDDTLARTKSNVLYTMPDGTTGKIDAATFAKEAGNMEAEGAKWDFSEFSKVMQGSKGPLLDVAKIIADKRGTKDVFVLTARPADAAGPIKEFLASMGLDIPLANITGLGDGTPQAKAGWIMGKAAEGYNDFYFADDHTGNVRAVKDVLSQIDVKSKVQLAKFSKTQTFDTIVNDMIEDSSGIETYKQYSAARAQTVGASKGRFNFFIPASAEDFTGLLYKMLGKGKKGDAQMAFLKTNLLDTYDRAESAVTQAKIAAANDFKALKQNLKTLPKSLSKPTGIGGFTFSHAVRVAVWSKQGMDIPGLSKRDIEELNNFVDNNAELSVFTNELMKIQKGKPYPKPGDNWLGGNITSDIINDINKVNRAEYQQEFRENVNIIFSEDNMNKMEAAYGTRWRKAMEDSLRRMKSGSNRPPGGNSVTDGLLDWLNNSVGAVMFLNTRSALLQTISAVNFINWGDNNIVKAGLAFANQKQFWSDFMTLMNSDYLVERREGLKINVSESEIADAVRDSKNKVKAAIAFLLSKGFVMTRFADSFAIATGGSTFYRNRVKALVGKGMEQKAAEAQAFEDFRQIAEESQQSSNPNRISQQQASGAGRVILAWANTPMQYARIQKRSAQDLVNGRGDWKTNVSKIVYYGAIQNLIFNSLQQAVFALGFGEDEDEEEMDAKKSEKISRVANGMIDSQLKGLGIGGAAVVALKSTLMELGKQYSKDRPKYEEAVFDLLGFSPPLGSKVQKINGGLRSFSWNMKDIKDKGLSLDNPAYLAGAQITTGLTNIPLDRVIKKLNSMRGIVSEQSSLWQKVALGLGWSTWDVGLGYYGGFDAAKVLTPEEEKVKEIDDMKKLTKTQEQIDMLLDLGLTKKEIKALGKEQVRVEKIIELQNAEANPKEEVKVKEEIKEETKPTPEVKAKPKNESAERRLRRQFDSIKDENKPDQVKTLLKFGLTKKEIRTLQYEKNRVNKILELMEKNK